MTIPPSALKYDEPLAPADELDFTYTITQAGIDVDDFPLLEADEVIASFSMSPSVEGVASGLTIISDTGRAPALNGKVVTYWLKVDPLKQTLPIFSNLGTVLGVELTVHTDKLRIKRRTVGVPVVNL